MPTKQTRRSISVRGTTYEALKQYCETHERSMSDLVEELLGGVLDKPAATEKPARARTVHAPARRPAANVANKVVRAAPPPPPVAGSQKPGAGRPAPTPAAKVIAERPRAPKGDYRVIQF